MTPAPRDPDSETRAGTVTPERFARVRAIFEAEPERPARDRLAYIDGACGGDHELLDEVQAMLAADATAHRSSIAHRPHHRPALQRKVDFPRVPKA